MDSCFTQWVKNHYYGALAYFLTPYDLTSSSCTLFALEIRNLPK